LFMGTDLSNCDAPGMTRKSKKALKNLSAPDHRKFKMKLCSRKGDAI